ncbi:MAG: cupin domain-containing protein [Dehalococcoidales bacterium]
MPKNDYEKYLVRKPLYEAFGGTKNRQSPTMTMMSNKQVPGSNHYIEPGWIYGIPDPNPSLHEHVHEFDEIVMHMGGNYKTPQVLGGEVEFYVGGQPITFNTSTAFFIPKGTPHGPVIWKKFEFPHLQMAIMCGTGSAGEAWGTSGIHDQKNVLPKKTRDFDFEQYVVRSPLREAGSLYTAGRTSPAMTYMSSVQVPDAKYYIEFQWTYGTPVLEKPGAGMREMVHDFDEIILHLGGDPQNPEDLGAELEFNICGRPLTYDTTSAFFIPRSLKHGPARLKQFRKPYMMVAIMCGVGTLK